MELIKRWLPLIFWVIFIFALSSIPVQRDVGITLPSGSDKVIHFFEYSILAMLLYRGFGYGREDSIGIRVALSVLSAAGLALMDEYYQSFIPERDASFMDLAADYAGIAAGMAVYYFRRKSIIGRKRKS